MFRSCGNKEQGGLKMKSFLFLFLMSSSVLAEDERPAEANVKSKESIELNKNFILLPEADAYLKQYKSKRAISNTLVNCIASNQKDKIRFGVLLNAVEWGENFESGKLTQPDVIKEVCFHIDSDNFIKIQVGVKPYSAIVLLSLNRNEEDPVVQTYDYLQGEQKYLNIGYRYGEDIYSAECITSSVNMSTIKVGTVTFFEDSSCDQEKSQ